MDRQASKLMLRHVAGPFRPSRSHPGIAGFVSFHASHAPPIALIAADGRGSLLLAEVTAADVS